MALGVLNNISAIFAENNLNATQSGLNKTLQQLSSGSKINSGADDAAGLSLVDGLAANSAALQQSSVNATEGVGLLQVADGALSQVTSLLNRAVTLATEASNGTLNTSQEAAANQEYQSILSEINNIGTTTTYNQEQVFGKNYNIYTGDSSSVGSSIDALSFGTLSSSSLGQTGTVSYSGGTNEFVNLSSATGNAQSTDSVTGSLDITYWDASTSAAKTVTVSSVDGTAGGMVEAINSLGLGITASFGTESQAEGATATNPTYTGIILTGGVSATAASATAPNAINVVEDATAFSDTSAPASTSTVSAVNSLGTPTISYTATSNSAINLGATGLDLTTASDAQSTLTAINSAISAVASQDGYIGAQINTLNAVSNVMSTQQENIVSAQNAVQATDYASATSNLSKYEILTQTGISALAQANSVEQEVTKLLQ